LFNIKYFKIITVYYKTRIKWYIPTMKQKNPKRTQGSALWWWQLNRNMQELINSERHNNRTVYMLVLTEFVNEFKMHRMNNMTDGRTVQFKMQQYRHNPLIHDSLIMVITNSYIFLLYETAIIRQHISAM
jgi:hypothetical protein